MRALDGTASLRAPLGIGREDHAVHDGAVLPHPEIDRVDAGATSASGAWRQVVDHVGEIDEPASERREAFDRH